MTNTTKIAITPALKTFKQGLKNASEQFDNDIKNGKNYFNVFDALGVSEKENYHSAFIVYLLNSQNEHYQTKFAELFLEKLSSKNIPIPDKFKNLKTDKMSVGIEVVTKKTKNKNRRMDILLSFDRNVSIIIENKIGAPDQKAQIKDYIKEIYARYSTKNKANYPLVIYLHPKKEAEPSEKSLTNKGGKWIINAKKGEIYDNKKSLQAYYLKLDYKWIKEWIMSCIEWLEGQKFNEFKKIIVVLKQYAEILEWYLSGEYDESNYDGTNAVIKFVMKSSENQKIALQIMGSKDRDLKEQKLYKYKQILQKSWGKICEFVVEKFYKKMLEKFNAKKVKINGKIWLCERLDENRVGCEQFRFYPQKYEGYTTFPRLFLYYDGSNFKDIGLSLCLCYEDISAKEHKELENIFQNNNKKNGINKFYDSYISTKVFDNEPIENFAEWLMKQGSVNKQVENFVRKIDNYIKNNAIIKETLMKLDELAKI